MSEPNHVESLVRSPARRKLLAGLAVLGLVVAVAAILHVLAEANSFWLSELGSSFWAYLLIFGLVFGDAICPVLPGETTLNAASTLAAAGKLDLGLVMLAGALGAVVGDSTLYLIARSSRGKLQPQLEKAANNDKVAAALGFLGSNAPVLLIAGRYVPGVRFAVNATMGLSSFPYRSFLLWSTIGGTVWAVYTCGLAYVVGTALAGFPLASVVISATITTLALAAIFLVARRRTRSPI